MRHPSLQGFIAFVGEGHVNFPTTLSELSEAVTLYECAVADTATPKRKYKTKEQRANEAASQINTEIKRLQSTRTLQSDVAEDR